MDTAITVLQGARLGIKSSTKNDSTTVTKVERKSPAWETGIRRGDLLISINDSTANSKTLTDVTTKSHAGDKILLSISKKGINAKVPITLDILSERKFTITPMANANKLQADILASWAPQ